MIHTIDNSAPIIRLLSWNGKANVDIKNRVIRSLPGCCRTAGLPE
jgi:hypothetical protein